ncbi:MAG: DUF1254 domain-containing protein [Pseudomonadota bacterium]
MHTNTLRQLGLALLMASLPILSSAAGKFKMTTPIPPEITTPDTVITRIGTLKFTDGLPDDATVAKVYDNLNFLRGVESFLNGVPGASMVAIRQGFHDLGAENGTIGIFETLMDSRSLFLTGNTESVYAMTWMNLKNGPMVVESAPNTLGIVNDFWFRYVTDMGNAGPDRGKGGKYLFLPPDFQGEIPSGYHVFKSPTYNNVLVWRGFMVKDDPRPAVANLKQHLRVYSLSEAASPPANTFINLSGRPVNTIHANDFKFYEEINQIVQEEPAAAMDPERLGLFASIGIIKGQPFAPDARMRKTLTEAAAVANATARAILYSTRDKQANYYPNSNWRIPFVGGSHEFLQDGARLLDARTMFHYCATMVTPAMTMKMVGAGSQYAFNDRDAQGRHFDGAKTYRLRMPPDAPVKNFWSLVVYDSQTRSMLQTDQAYPSIGTQRPDLQQNPDGSVDVYFGPKAPAGKESNWVQTVPGKSWNVLLRLYGPLQPWFDKSWRPGEFELMK